MEIWKTVKGYRGGFEVSNLGNVRRVIPMKGILSNKNRCGYLRVFLRKSDTLGEYQRMVPVHRLVTLAFVGEIPDSYVVNHKNGIKTDNRLENLEIVTKREDRKHAFRELGQERMQGSRHGRSKLTEEQVLEIRRLGANREHGIGTKLAKQFGVGPQIISFILNRKNWKHI